MKDTIASLLEEEKELTAKAFGTPEDEVEKPETTGDETEASTTESQTDTEETPTEDTGAVTPEPQPVADEQTDSKIDNGENWELRYKNLRSSRDQKLYDTKRQLSGALQTISTLQAQVAELQQSIPKSDPLEGVFDDKDIENLGETTVDALTKATKKATQAATASLEKQLQEQRELRERDQENLRARTTQEAYDIFISRVAAAVPNWEAINYEKGFEEYLTDLDLDGNQRKAYFTQAEKQGNAALIIRYMLEYEATKAKPKVVSDPLADKVTPTGEDSGADQGIEEDTKETVSRSFINKFYDDVNRGLYKGRYTEQQKIEAMIDLATMERRIV